MREGLAAVTGLPTGLTGSGSSKGTWDRGKLMLLLLLGHSYSAELGGLGGVPFPSA